MIFYKQDGFSFGAGGTDTDFGAGLGEDDTFTPDNAAGGMEDDDIWKELNQESVKELEQNQSLIDHITGLVSQAYGQNAAERWKGTPAVGFAGASNRQPIYKPTGSYTRGGVPIIGQRIDASTHWATPPEGLVGGKAAENQAKFGVNSSLTPTAQWNAQFQQHAQTGPHSWEPGAPTTALQIPLNNPGSHRSPAESYAY